MEEIPKQFLTPQENSNKNIINLESENGKKIKVEINEYKDSNSLEIIMSFENDLTKSKYRSKYTLEELQNIHKIFRASDTISEAFELIKDAFDSKTIKIQKENGNLCLEMNFILGKKENKFKFILLKKSGNMRDILDGVCNKIEKIEKELNSIVSNNNLNVEILNKISKIENKQNKMNKNVEELNKRFDQINKRIDKIEFEVFGDQNFNLGKLFINNDEKNLIKNAIKERINKKPKSAKLLFSTLTDGDESSTFHQKCDNIKNTLVVTKANGKRFGGFTTQIWNKVGDSTYKDDKMAFLFSLDNMEIYNYKNDGNAIYCYSDYGPIFGAGCDLVICNNCLSSKNSYARNQESYDYKGKNLALIETEDNFLIEQYDIYEIIFIE